MTAKWSNCHWEAWKKFRAEDAEYLCIRFTQFSRVTWAHKWWWIPFRCFGTLLQWVVWPLTHVGELLRTGRWYHATWIHPDTAHWEFTPVKKKRARYYPPILFKGIYRLINKEGATDGDEGAT